MRNLIAQKQIDLGDPLKGFGSLGLDVPGGGAAAPGIFNKFISGTIGLMTVIAAIWFTFLVITGAYGIMSSGGDKTAMETARKIITSGVVGFIVVIAAIFIVELIGKIIGFDLILNPAQLIKEISPGG
jgi:hypothetical protein